MNPVLEPLLRRCELLASCEQLVDLAARHGELADPAVGGVDDLHVVVHATADLLARTTIANESSGLPVEGFPIEGWTRREDMSDDDDDEGEEGGTTEEGYYLLNRDEYLALVIERSPSPDF